MSQTPVVISVHRPAVCDHCQQPFAQEQRAVAIDKVHDLPPVRIVVTELR